MLASRHSKAVWPYQLLINHRDVVFLSFLAVLHCSNTVAAHNAPLDCGYKVKSPCTMESNNVRIVEDQFGYIKNETTGSQEIVRRFTMTNCNNMTVQIITYGATITSIQVPDKHGHTGDVVLGFDNIEGYRTKNNPYFGAVIGRVANRIGNAEFTLGNHTYHLYKNAGNDSLHGGLRGFDKVLWESHVQGNKLTLSYLSKDGEEGYPGEVLTQATYYLTPDNRLVLEMTATSTKPTPVNLANHAYFNLAGNNAGAAAIFEHEMSVNADTYTVVNADSIPTGEIRAVGGTPFDLRIPTLLGKAIPAADKFDHKGGLDHNLCVTMGNRQGLNFVSRVVHKKSGRVLEVNSDQPGVQVYTANNLPEVGAADQVIGKGGAEYHKWGAFCLETQDYPDAVNHPNFPNSILIPGVMYNHTTTYHFFVSK